MLCHRAMAEVIFLLGPNRLVGEQQTVREQTLHCPCPTGCLEDLCNLLVLPRAPSRTKACCDQELRDIKVVWETTKTEKHSPAKLSLPGCICSFKGRDTNYLTDTHVMPISLRSLSVRVRKILRSTSCSSNTCRYFRHPICSRNVARSCSPYKNYLCSHKQQHHLSSSP